MPMQSLIDRIASAPVVTRWTAGLYPPEQRGDHEFCMLEVSIADRLRILQGLKGLPPERAAKPRRTQARKTARAR